MCRILGRLAAGCTILALVGCGCSDRSVKVVAESMADVPAGATELIIREPVDDATLELIGARSNLEILELYQADCSADALTQCIKQLRFLKRLRIEGVVVSTPTLVAVSELRDLQILNLPTTGFTDETLAAIAQLPELQLLRFGSRDVTDHGISLLASAPALRFLHLLNVPITDAGLRAFHDMSQLESFYIDGGSETDAGIQALLESNPTLHFHQNQLHVADDPGADEH